jgi:hypothetical protein
LMRMLFGKRSMQCVRVRPLLHKALSNPGNGADARTFCVALRNGASSGLGPMK